jgi:hypothetical protein
VEQLLRVIAVGHTTPQRTGGVVVLASVEIWSDGVVLRTAEDTTRLEPSPPAPDFDPVESTTDWQLTDDLDNHYELSGGPAGGASGRIFGTVLYHPCVAANATTLRIVAPQMAVHAPIEVPLSA